MGNWGIGVLQDDDAADVELVFRAALARGAGVAAASRTALDNAASLLDDVDSAATIYLALAALQLEQGALDPALRDRARAVIESGEALDRWEGSPPDRAAAREGLLKRFALLLERGTASEEELHDVTTPKAFSLW